MLSLVPGAGRLHAQSAPAASASAWALTAGPYFVCGPSLHLGAPADETIGSVFAFRIGVAARFPLAEHLAGTLDMGCDSRGIDRLSAGNEAVHTVTRVGYFTFTPGFAISSFWFGLNLGIPLAASQTVTAGSTHRSVSLSGDEFNAVEYLIEPRIGATVTVFDQPRGRLDLMLGAGMTLNAIALGDAAARDDSTARGDFRMVTGHIGLSYQFVLPGEKGE
jgi:hypothetical protein